MTVRGKVSSVCQPQVVSTVGHRHGFRFREERTTRSVLIRFQQDSEQENTKLRALLYQTLAPSALIRPLV